MTSKAAGEKRVKALRDVLDLLGEAKSEGVVKPIDGALQKD